MVARGVCIKYVKVVKRYKLPVMKFKSWGYNIQHADYSKSEKSGKKEKNRLNNYV